MDCLHNREASKIELFIRSITSCMQFRKETVCNKQNEFIPTRDGFQLF
jgi:hypothetical protein